MKFGYFLKSCAFNSLSYYVISFDKYFLFSGFLET